MAASSDEKNKREDGIEQRGERGADIAEARAAREQVHVDAIACRVIADRQAREPDECRNGGDRPDRVRKAVVDDETASYCLEHEKRYCANCRIGHAQFRPAAKRARREAQRVVLEGLVADPGVVVAAHLDDALRARRAHGRVTLGHEDDPDWCESGANGANGRAARDRRPMQVTFQCDSGEYVNRRIPVANLAFYIASNLDPALAQSAGRPIRRT